MKATEEKPAHQVDARYMTQSGMIVEGSTPRMSSFMAGTDEYMTEVVTTCYPRDKFMKECRESWDQYQLDWWRQGWDFNYVPYPYTDEMVQGFFDEYESKVGPTSLEKLRKWRK